MTRDWSCLRWAARRECIPRATPGLTLPTRTASENCFTRCAARKAKSAARTLCALLALAEAGEARGVFSASAEGELLEAPRGQNGFGYDPIFFFPALGKTYAEISGEEKNLHSHRGKAFRKALEFLIGRPRDALGLTPRLVLYSCAGS